MFDLLILVFGAIVVGFFLIFLLALSEKKHREKTPQTGPTWSREFFEKACVEILERMKLEIEAIERAEDNSLEIIAKNPAPFIGGTIYVRCVYLDPNQIISAPEILEISNMIVQDRLSKGILITSGRFTDEIPSIGELAPMEFIDSKSLQELMDKWKILP